MLGVLWFACKNWETGKRPLTMETERPAQEKAKL